MVADDVVAQAPEPEAVPAKAAPEAETGSDLETAEPDSEKGIDLVMPEAEKGSDLLVPEAEKGSDLVKEEKLTPARLALVICGALISFWVFLVGLQLMGGSFKVLGGRGASNMLTAVDNPISGLMTGILGTVMLQSSSTSTSIVVSMVGENVVSVSNAIPIIMGANIGTSVTNTLVSLSQAGDRITLERAFAGATVHDMFNMLCVATLLPLEIITGAISGEGGLLYWISKGLTDAFVGGEKGSELFSSPTKAITSPVAAGIMKENKYVIYALSLPVPQEQKTNLTSCPGSGRLSGEDREPKGSSERSLLSRRLSTDCSRYMCVDESMDKNFKKISSSSYKKLTECGNILDGIADCGKDECYLDGGKYYEDQVVNGRLIKGGFLEGAGDTAGGILALIISILLLTGGLIGLTKCLSMVFLASAKKILQCAVNLNDYVAILIGMAITIVVQSSSVTTSSLTPLCGIGVLPLDKMLPLTLGANIGTTTTALIAALVDLKPEKLQIALVHLCFNLIGILIWFPIPVMRRFPLRAAETLGLYASFFRWVPAAYIFVAFVIVPAVFLGVVEVFKASIVGGIIVLLILLSAFGAFEVAWWVGIPKGNALSLKVLSEEQRTEGRRALEEANARLQGKASVEGTEMTRFE